MVRKRDNPGKKQTTCMTVTLTFHTIYHIDSVVLHYHTIRVKKNRHHSSTTKLRTDQLIRLRYSIQYYLPHFVYLWFYKLYVLCIDCIRIIILCDCSLLVFCK
jgi:hypothetical protein